LNAEGADYPGQPVALPRDRSTVARRRRGLSGAAGRAAARPINRGAPQARIIRAAGRAAARPINRGAPQARIIRGSRSRCRATDQPWRAAGADYPGSRSRCRATDQPWRAAGADYPGQPVALPRDRSTVARRRRGLSGAAGRAAARPIYRGAPQARHG